MKNQETGKVNASLVLSMIALFVAISGAATAAKNSGPPTKLPPNSVGTAQLKPGAVQTTDLGKKAVVGSKLAPKAVTSTVLAPNAVTNTALAPNAVTSTALAPGSILPIALGPESVTTAALAPGAVDSNKIKDDAVSSQKLKTGAVTGPKLGVGSVSSEVIQDGAIETSKIGPGAVTNQKLSDGAVSSPKIEGGAVTGAKIEEGAVTSQKIGQGAVLAGKLGERAVTPDKLDAPPGALVSASNVALSVSAFVCMGKIPDFTGVSRNVGGVFAAAQPSRLTAPIDGIYRVTASLTWPTDPDGTRMLFVRRHAGSGPNVGTPISTQTVSANPSVDQATDQAIATDFVMEAGDYVTMTALTCPVGGIGTVSQATLGMTWAGPAS